MKIKILFVEDDRAVRALLVEQACEDGYQAAGAANADAAINLLKKEDFDIVVTDVRMPGLSGLDLLLHIAELRPRAVTLVLTAYGSIGDAIIAMRRGASDYLTKPLDNEQLSSALRVAANRVSQKREMPIEGKSAIAPIIAESGVMTKLLEEVKIFAPRKFSVLVTGETGTGKELIARAIHELSPRRDKSFVALNCAAVPRELLEKELFGHERGAFTGAHTSGEGRFGRADGGTLFLDEIGDMDYDLQPKLLRVLEESVFEKLGGARPIEVDVRVVAATSADLPRLIEEKKFRRDLYYRLNKVMLELPPLRERPADIRPIAEQLLAHFCASSEGEGLPPKTLDAAVWPALSSYCWPGNVRQLRNAIERAAVISAGEDLIRLTHFPEEVRGGATSGVSAPLAARTSFGFAQPLPAEGIDLKAQLADQEKQLLLQALKEANGNHKLAAEKLRLPRSTFIEKTQRYGIGK
ncbi:MAG: sigma-54-dependent Fis family transcriptional regulator [Pyrinomonadaceae bacterium]|nr:sigma-54-dependent Fis family transcriptional regulator [Pyrinomonadaceae bacterium]